MDNDNKVISFLTDRNDFQLEPVQDKIDFNNEYTKIKLTKNQKSQISMAVQHIPEIMASESMCDAYILTFPDGINHSLVSLKQGGFMSTYTDGNGNFAGTGSLYSLKAEAVLLQAFSIMAIVSGQYFITKIHSELKMINQSLDKILEFLYGDKKSELLSEVTFIKYAYENYSSIMEHPEQRIATISSIQGAKKIAVKDIEFYMCDLEARVNEKRNINDIVVESFNVKESLDLSIQLFGLCCVLEVYYSQNQDVEYIQRMQKETNMYIDKCEKRMLSSFSTLRKYINDYKGRLLEKIDKTEYEQDVGGVIDLLNNGEESDIRKSVRKTLQAAMTNKEYCVSKDGNVYLKVMS